MTQDERSIRRIVEQLETAWNAGDSTAFAAPFAEDADFVDILGEHHRGRSVIEAGHRHILSTFYQGSQNHYTVESIRFVRPDVAIVFIRARLLSRLGVAVDDARHESHQSQTMREDQARPTLTVAKEGETWQIVAFQNTRIAEVRAV